MRDLSVEEKAVNIANSEPEEGSLDECPNPKCEDGWLDGEEELYNNVNDPFQMENLAENDKDPVQLEAMRRKLEVLLKEAHDEFLPGTEYAAWFDPETRDVIRTALGSVNY